MSLKFYLLLLLIMSARSFDQKSSEQAEPEVKIRTKRGTLWDFFQKMFTTANLIYDQYNDTKTTFNEVYNIVADGFSDPDPKGKYTTTTTTSTTSTTRSPSDTADGDDENMSTSSTTEKYRISRYELGRVLGRNFRGIKRLLRIEWNDALNQSHYNIEGYRQEKNRAFTNSVILEKKNQIKGFTR